MINPMFIYAAIAVIAILVAMAAYYHVRLYNKNVKLSENEAELRKTLADNRQKNINSVEIIARAVLDDQVTLTEASIRINALIQAIRLEEDKAKELSVFRQLAEATAHIPILEKWKALSRKEKRDYEKERESIEDNFRDFVVVASEKIARNNLLR
ncbi:MAG: DUF2489 domain-containing protein [Agarilytica sp.]